MKKLSILIIFSLAMFAVLTATGQSGKKGISIQAGYQLKYLTPRSVNFIIGKYNSSVSLTRKMEEIKWANGFSAGLGYHSGRASFRLSGMLFNAQTYAIGPDNNGQNFRRDVQLHGGVVSLGLNSELIKFYSEGGFNVGGSFDLTNFRTATAQVAEASFDENTALSQVSNAWMTSFTILAPFRFGFGPVVKLSIEPYYQIFFGRLNYRQLNQAVNGSSVPSNSPELLTEPDHAGINATLMIYLRRR
ncbi:MAG: hypothetical protein R3D00_13965 [Bacteroidia bacterium]